MGATTKSRVPLFGGDVFNQIVALLMTLIVVQTAVITFWFSLADDADGDAGRDAQMFALQGLGKRTVGSIQSAYDETGAFHRWLELETLAKLADQKNDPASAKQLRATRDRIAKLSPLLNPPYFDPARDTVPDIAAYQSDTFWVEAVALTERFEHQARLKAQWSDRASAYTVMLTLLAVTLFLLGVSTSSPRRLRRLFFVIGISLASLVLLWMLLIYAQPVVTTPDEAILAYARGTAKYHQNRNNEAIQEFDRALALAPDYTNAYRDRAWTKYYAGDYAGSRADFEAAVDLGDTGSETASGLAYANYLLGNLEDATFWNAVAVSGANDIFWVRAVAALNTLVTSGVQEGRAEHEALLAEVAQSVKGLRARGEEPPASLWFEFDDAAIDLTALADCASRQVCTRTPPFTVLKHPADIAAAAQELATKLREYSVALEYTSAPPVANNTAQVGEFVFTRELSADNVTVQGSDTFTATDAPVYVLIPFRNFSEGQQIVLKVYVDGYEDDRLRVVSNYSLTEMGGADADIFLAITTGGIPLTAGEYHIEMYVDSKLVRTGEFQVVAAGG